MPTETPLQLCERFVTYAPRTLPQAQAAVQELLNTDALPAPAAERARDFLQSDRGTLQRGKDCLHYIKGALGGATVSATTPVASTAPSSFAVPVVAPVAPAGPALTPAATWWKFQKADRKEKSAMLAAPATLALLTRYVKEEATGLERVAASMAITGAVKEGGAK